VIFSALLRWESQHTCLTGDHIYFGDHKEAKAVFDLDSVQLLESIQCLESGFDLSGKRLDGIPSFFSGAALHLRQSRSS